jgi:transposase
MSKRAWIGIDVAKETFYAAVADEATVPRHWATLPAEQFDHSAKGLNDFLRWLKRLDCTGEQVVGICIEATGRFTQQWIDLLNGRLPKVSVVNPALPRAFAQTMGLRDKSDRVDACVIALFANATQPKQTPADSPAQRELRELSRLRHKLENDRQAYQQRLTDNPPSSLARATIKKTIAALNHQVSHLEQAMDGLIRSDATLYKDFKRAKTVKGIGAKTAMLILAEFGDLRRYNRDQVVALAGLYPREFTSGTSVHKKARIAKAGKASVRAALYMCAMSAIQANAQLRQFAQRLKDNGKQPMQVLVAVMRKLLVFVHAVVVSEKDYDNNYAQALESQTA